MVNNPNIRFAGFSDDWVQRKLGEITQIKTGSSDLQDAVVDGEYPFFVRSDIIEKSNRYIFDGEAILIPGEGRIGEIYHYINDKFDFHQRVYKISGFSESDTYGKYVLYYMQKMFKQHAMKFTVKATVDSLRLPILSQFDIKTPTLKEQQKIGSIFSTLDHNIGLEERQMSLLKAIKKGYLQKMFPKDGATGPEIRFKGFSDDWKERKLGDESTITAGGDIDKSKLKEFGEYPIFANALTNDGIVGYYDSYYRVEAPAVTVTGRGDVGHAKARKVNFTPVVRLLTVKSNHDVDFLENAINNHKVLVESTGVPQLTAPQLGNYKIFFPTGEEQQKIGSFFKQLDDTIAHQQRKLDLLKDLKKGLSQQMFV